MPEQEKKPVLVHLTVDCIKQLDILAGFYSKTRLAVIRDILQRGIKEHSDTYVRHQHELREMDRIFNEMSNRATEKEQKLKAANARWEDSY